LLSSAAASARGELLPLQKHVPAQVKTKDITDRQDDHRRGYGALTRVSIDAQHVFYYYCFKKQNKRSF